MLSVSLVNSKLWKSSDILLLSSSTKSSKLPKNCTLSWSMLKVVISLTKSSISKKSNKNKPQPSSHKSHSAWIIFMTKVSLTEISNQKISFSLKTEPSKSPILAWETCLSRMRSSKLHAARHVMPRPKCSIVNRMIRKKSTFGLLE